MKKAVYITLGCFFLILAIIGVILPILPTVPFLLLVSFFFVKGSDRLNNWFINTKLYKTHVMSFKETKALTLKKKLSILIPVYLILGTLFIAKDILAMRITIALLLTVKTYVFFVTIKTLPPENKKPHYDAEQTIY